ncbi:alpha-actinin, partial [Coemansia sp. RSA 2049]
MPGGHTRTSMTPKAAVDKSWELVQSKTFTKWVNARLSEHSLAPLSNVCTDFSDGTALVNLLQIISDTSLGRYNRNPRMRIQKIENVNLSLDFIR